MSQKMILQIPREIYEAMVEQARRELPNECVGMLVGTAAGVVKERYPLVNEMESPKRFLSEPLSMFKAEKRRRAAGHEFLAIYHSHPGSPATPSRLDVADHYFTEVMCVIVSLAGEAAQVRGWWIAEGQFSEGEIAVGTNS